MNSTSTAGEIDPLPCSAAVRATSERDAAIKALIKWWGEFEATAQVALKDRPDLLKLVA